MALHTERVCDYARCSKPGEPVVVWREGEQTGRSIDLCADHWKPLGEALARGTTVELPTKPRQKMDVTPLRTIESTAHLKRSRKRKSS